MLKAIYVRRKGEQAPYIHNLLRLAEHVNLPITKDRKSWFIRVTSFNLATLSSSIDSRIEPVPFRPETFVDEDPLAWEIKRKGIRVD